MERIKGRCPRALASRCRLQLERARSPPWNVADFGEAYAAELWSRLRARCSDYVLELRKRNGASLELVTREELRSWVREDVVKFFDPEMRLTRDDDFYARVSEVSLSYGLMKIRPLRVQEVLQERRRALLPAPDEGAPLDLLRLPLTAIASFFRRGERSLRSVCVALREGTPWSPKAPAPVGRLGPDVALAAARRLREILYRGLRIRRSETQVSREDVMRSARRVLIELDVSRSSWTDHCDALCYALGLSGMVGAAFDEEGSFVVFWDCCESAPPPQSLRDAAESLRCLGASADVLGPFSYPRGSRPVMAEDPAFRCLRGGCLRLGAIWALRVARATPRRGCCGR
jgi:hypothetical protein